VSRSSLVPGVFREEAMKALDRDLRERILRAVDRGEPMTRIAARLEVGLSTVKKWNRRRRQTGAAEPLTSRCGRKRVVTPEQGERLAELARAGGRTLELLRAELGLVCSLTTVWKELRRRGLRHKKSRPTRPSRPGPTSPRGVGAGATARTDARRGGSTRGGSSSSTRPGPRRT
jgi:transposase